MDKKISRFWQRTNYLPSQVMMVLVTSTVTLIPTEQRETVPPKGKCVTGLGRDDGGGRSPVIEIHEKITVVHCHFNFTMFAGPPQK